MELFAEHAGLQEFNRKNLKQVFHRVGLNLAEQGKLTVTRQPGTFLLLFAAPTKVQDAISTKEMPVHVAESSDTSNSEGSLTFAKKFEELAEQDEILKVRENELLMLLEIASEKCDVFEMELKNSLRTQDNGSL